MQTKLASFLEIFIGNFLSFLIDVLFILIVAPMLGYKIQLIAITGGVAILYVIHILKSFLYRRFWNYLLMKRYK